MTVDPKSTITPFDRANSQLQNTIFQHSHHHYLCIFASDEWQSLHDTLLAICPSATTAETHHSPSHCAHIHCLVSITIKKAQVNVNGRSFFHGGIQYHTFASQALPYQMPFCQTPPPLPSVTLQQYVTGYWWEGSASTAISPISAQMSWINIIEQEALLSEQSLQNTQSC